MSLPAGYAAREVVLVDDDGPDVDAAFAVVAADTASVLGFADETREGVRFALTNPDAVRAEHRLITDASGAAVAVLFTEREAGHERASFDVSCRPELKRLLLPSLIDLGLEAAARIAPGEVRTSGPAQDAELMDALAAAGFAFLRRFWRMRIDLVDQPRVDPPAPDGVTKTVALTENDLRLMHSVHESAFADHFGAHQETFEAWSAWFDGQRHFRPDLRWLAWRDGAVVGETIGDDSRAEFDAAYVRTLSVLSSERGRGIGRWLLLCHFAQAARDGRSSVILTVDSDNTTGATRLYESVGMRPVRVIDVLARPA